MSFKGRLLLRVRVKRYVVVFFLEREIVDELRFKGGLLPRVAVRV